MFYHNTNIQVMVNERNHPTILYTSGEQFYQFAVIDCIKETFYIEIYTISIAAVGILLNTLESIMSTTVGTEPKAVVMEMRFINCYQNLTYRLLEETINYGRNTKLTHLTVSFWDFHTSYGMCDALTAICHS